MITRGGRVQECIDIVKANIALTELKAPFDGIIGLRNVSEGAYASPSLTIATLTKITPLKIEFSIPEVYAGNIKNGAPIEFSVDGYMKPFRARVYASDSRLDEDTHTFSLPVIPIPTGLSTRDVSPTSNSVLRK